MAKPYQKSIVEHQEQNMEYVKLNEGDKLSALLGVDSINDIWKFINPKINFDMVQFKNYLRKTAKPTRITKLETAFSEYGCNREVNIYNLDLPFPVLLTERVGSNSISVFISSALDKILIAAEECYPQCFSLLVKEIVFHEIMELQYGGTSVHEKVLEECYTVLLKGFISAVKSLSEEKEKVKEEKEKKEKAEEKVTQTDKSNTKKILKELLDKQWSFVLGSENEIVEEDDHIVLYKKNSSGKRTEGFVLWWPIYTGAQIKINERKEGNYEEIFMRLNNEIYLRYLDKDYKPLVEIESNDKKMILSEDNYIVKQFYRNGILECEILRQAKFLSSILKFRRRVQKHPRDIHTIVEDAYHPNEHRKIYHVKTSLAFEWGIDPNYNDFSSYRSWHPEPLLPKDQFFVTKINASFTEKLTRDRVTFHYSKNEVKNRLWNIDIDGKYLVRNGILENSKFYVPRTFIDKICRRQIKQPINILTDIPLEILSFINEVETLLSSSPSSSSSSSF